MVNLSSIEQNFRRLATSKTLIAACLTVASLSIADLSFHLIPRSTPFLTAAANAQTSVTTEEIVQYARSVLEIDGYRTEAYTQIKDLLQSVNLDIDQLGAGCSDTQAVANLPRTVRKQVQELLVGYCNQAQDIVEVNGLTSRRFNEITSAHRENAVLSQQIQQELIRLQQAN